MTSIDLPEYPATLTTSNDAVSSVNANLGPSHESRRIAREEHNRTLSLIVSIACHSTPNYLQRGPRVHPSANRVSICLTRQPISSPCPSGSGSPMFSIPNLIRHLPSLHPALTLSSASCARIVFVNLVSMYPGLPSSSSQRSTP